MTRERHRYQRQHLPSLSEQGEWPAVDDALLQALPAVLRGVVKALGYGRAIEWLRWNGGVERHIPARLKNSDNLGLETDELARLRVALINHIDHENRLWLPKAEKIMLYMRNANIRRERATKSVRDIAIENRLTDRQVRNITRDGAEAAELKVDPRQMWLIDPPSI